MEKTWLKGCPAGVPADGAIGMADAPSSVMAATCQRFSGRTAFVSPGAPISFDQPRAMAQGLAAYLRDTLGLARGERMFSFTTLDKEDIHDSQTDET